MASCTQNERITALSVFALPAVLSCVIAIAQFTDGYMAAYVFYILQIILLAIALVATFIIGCFGRQMNPQDRRTRAEQLSVWTRILLKWITERSQTQRNDITRQNLKTIFCMYWTRIPLKWIAIGTCLIGSVTFPAYRIYEIADCLKYSVFARCNVCVLVLVILFYVSQFVLIISCRQYRCQNTLMRISLALILSTYVCLTVDEYLNVFRALNTYKSPTHAIVNQTEEPKTYLFYTCLQSNISNMNISNAYKIYSYVSPFSFQFALLITTWLCAMWNLACEDPSSNSQDDIQDKSQNQSSTSNSIWNTILCKMYNMSFKAFWISLSFCIAKFILHVVSNHQSNMGTKYDITPDSELFSQNSSHSTFTCVDYYLQTFYTYASAVVALFGFVLIKTTNLKNQSLDCSEILLLVSSFGYLVLLLLETVDCIAMTVKKSNSENIIYLSKLFCHYIALYFQLVVIIKFRRMSQQYHALRKKQQIAKGILIYIGVNNFENWVVDSFLPPSSLEFVSHSEIRGFQIEHWWIIMQFVYPLVIFYRLISVLIIFKICKKIARVDQTSCVNTTSHERLNDTQPLLPHMAGQG